MSAFVKLCSYSRIRCECIGTEVRFIDLRMSGVGKLCNIVEQIALPTLSSAERPKGGVDGASQARAASE